MEISVVIPTYNEEQTIADTLAHLQEVSEGLLAEVIVVDGSSSDGTVQQAKKTGAQVVISPEKGRAAQMNYGARQATGDVFYFLHADSLPPEKFDRQIARAVSQGYPTGCFQLQFDWDHPALNFYGWCTRFDCNAFRFGDQSLFVEKKLFNDLNGFKRDYIVMEDNDIVRRLQKKSDFKILSDQILTSARKYRENGVIRLQVIFMIIFVLYFLGMSQDDLGNIYKRFID